MYVCAVLLQEACVSHTKTRLTKAVGIQNFTQDPSVRGSFPVRFCAEDLSEQRVQRDGWSWLRVNENSSQGWAVLWYTETSYLTLDANMSAPCAYQMCVFAGPAKVNMLFIQSTQAPYLLKLLRIHPEVRITRLKLRQFLL